MNKLEQDKRNSAKMVTISSDYEGQRIDNFLISYIKGVPKSHIYRLLRTGQVRVNKGRAKPQQRLQPGDLVRIPPVRISTNKSFESPPEALCQMLSDRILYQDADLIVLNKPAGIAAHGGSGIRFGVIEILRAVFAEDSCLDLVHRLDRATSGCLLIARNRPTLLALQDGLRSGAIKKLYIALLAGHWPSGHYTVTTPLSRQRLQSGERIVTVADEGKPSVTHFIVTTCQSQASLAHIRLDTGRMHQIRVHAASVGHPVAGDEKYGDKQFNRLLRQQGLKRLFLHASALEFHHPATGQLLSVHAPLDSELADLLVRLNLQEGLDAPF